MAPVSEAGLRAIKRNILSLAVVTSTRARADARLLLPKAVGKRGGLGRREAKR